MTIPNAPLLQATMQHILAHPDQYAPKPYRTATTLDFMARAVIVAGGEWARPVDAPGMSRGLLVAVDDDPPTAVTPGEARCWYANRARRILGITEGDQLRIGDAETTGVHALGRIVAGLAAEGDYERRAAGQPSGEVSCGCPPGETDTLDGVTIPRHTYSCPNHNEVGPRWYTWQGFDEPACLEAGTLVDFARAWALHRHMVHVASTAIAPIEVRTWDRTYQAVITEQTVDAESLHGTYLIAVEEESVTEMIGLADPTRT